MGIFHCQVGSYEVTQIWQKPFGSDAQLVAPAWVAVRTSAASADTAVRS